MPSGSRVDAKHQLRKFRNLGIMKKTYITPKMKAVKVQASAIICTSPVSVKLNSESVTLETNEETGAGIAW